MKLKCEAVNEKGIIKPCIPNQNIVEHGKLKGIFAIGAKEVFYWYLFYPIREYFALKSGYFRTLFLVRSTANLKCYWGGKTCAKWTNHIIEQQSCDDPELGYLDLDKSTDRFCDNDLQLDWVELGGRRIGNTKLIMRTKRRIWYVFMR